MCGICAVVGPNVSEDTKAALQRMISALSHRGPDARGELIQAGCQPGHASLSIIDLVSGYDFKAGVFQRGQTSLPVARAD